MEKHLPDNRITLLAETNFRNHRRRFGIRRADRRAHMYVIGKTGTGKSTLIANLARQDALHGEGFALLDPQYRTFCAWCLAECLHQKKWF